LINIPSLAINLLVELDIALLPNLVKLAAEHNNLSSIKWENPGISNKTHLEDVRISHNPILGGLLDARGWTKVHTILARDCNLSEIKLGVNDKLKYLYAHDNNLSNTVVDFSNCPNLENALLHKCYLKGLVFNTDPSRFTYQGLTWLEAYNNSSMDIFDHLSQATEIDFPLFMMGNMVRLSLQNTSIKGIDAGSITYNDLTVT
jgi:Leucine-rich repeat (LRR) protein